MQYHHITYGKGMSGKVCRVVYIKLGINILKAHALLQLPAIDKGIILSGNRNPLFFKVIHIHKTKEEQERSLEKAGERLRSLPEHQQDAIADKYYGGVRRW